MSKETTASLLLVQVPSFRALIPRPKRSSLVISSLTECSFTWDMVGGSVVVVMPYSAGGGVCKNEDFLFYPAVSLPPWVLLLSGFVVGNRLGEVLRADSFLV